jgi:hypothetical protein
VNINGKIGIIIEKPMTSIRMVRNTVARTFFLCMFKGIEVNVGGDGEM